MMKKLIFRLFVAIIAVMSITSCQSSPSLEDIAKQASKECPVQMPGLGQLTSISYKDNNITYNVLVLNQAFDIQLLEENKDEFKAGAAPMMQKLLNEQKDKELTDKMLEEKAGFAFRFYRKVPKEEVVIVFTPDEVAKMVKE